MASNLFHVRSWLATPVAGDSVLWARRLFFALASLAALRFWAKGWISEFYVEPSYHFTWPGLRFVRPLSQAGMTAVFAAMALSAACATVDRLVRPAALIFATLFVYVELIDRTYYLNHYYLITLIAILFALTSHAVTEHGGIPRVPRWLPLLLRVQVGLVYLYAGIAKLNADFLLRGEPLHTWLSHYGHLPYLGSLLADPITAVTMSWAGTLFDLFVIPTLLFSATRPYAYAALIGFHIVTCILLDIGVFPWFMMALATLFFSYDWPRRLPRPRPVKDLPSVQARPLRLRPGTTAWLAGYVLLQVALPLRHVLYPGPVNWGEEGFRFAWRVMLFEKAGHVEYRVQDAQTGRVTRVSPKAELTTMQANMLSTQPDMIRQYAVHLAERMQSATQHAMRVYADTAISVNGRRALTLLDPTCDLAAPLFPLSHDPCILQAPQDTP